MRMHRKSCGEPLFSAAFAVAAALLWLLLTPSEGVRFAMEMGPGWNLANTLDAYGLGRNAGDASVYERYWAASRFAGAD